MGNACYREGPNAVCVDTGSIDESTAFIENVGREWSSILQVLPCAKRIHSIAFYPKNSEKLDACISERLTYIFSKQYRLVLSWLHCESYNRSKEVVPSEKCVDYTRISKALFC